MKNKMQDKEELIEQIRYLLESESGRKWSAREIGDILGYHGGRLKILRAALDDLARSGILHVGPRGAFTLAQGGDMIEGRLEMVRSGAGFVSDPEHGRTLRIAPGDTMDAMPGDIVLVRPVKVGHDAESGRIVKIVSRSEKIICGTLFVSGNNRFVVSIDPAYPRDIPVASAPGAKNGDRVVVRFKNGNDPHDLPEGEIVDVIGPADNPSLDTEVVCRQYELPGEFPRNALAEATDVGRLLETPGERLDLRKKYILTVDPATSRDFDDALSFTKNKDGSCELGVHIADVSHFVRPGSALDAEAARRGNSIYLADKVIPMLPEQLCNGVCSLRPHEDRLSFSVFLTFDKNGNVTKRAFAKSIIRSKLRLNYGQALAIIEDRPPEGMDKVPKPAQSLLKGATELALRLRTARMKRGALDLDVPECRPVIDENGRMTGFEVEEYDVSHQMIEECMVVANEAVAAELASRGRKIIARLHEAPAPAKIADLTISLRTLGLRPGDITKPENLSRFIASIAEHPLRAEAHTMILRSMKRALYSAEATGHFGLAKHFYSHFTSPIRRYPDLVLHRQLADFLARRNDPAFSEAYLKNVAAACTETEQRADEAERTLLEIKKYRFLQQQIDDRKVEEYEAVVAKVTSFGLFVDLPELMVGGLIHISAISDKFVRFNAGDESLAVDGRRFALGTRLKVHVARVDFNARKLDFAVVREQQQPSPKGRQPRKHKEKKWTSK